MREPLRRIYFALVVTRPGITTIDRSANLSLGRMREDEYHREPTRISKAPNFFRRPQGWAHLLRPGSFFERASWSVRSSTAQERHVVRLLNVAIAMITHRCPRIDLTTHGHRVQGLPPRRASLATARPRRAHAVPGSMVSVECKGGPFGGSTEAAPAMTRVYSIRFLDRC